MDRLCPGHGEGQGRPNGIRDTALVSVIGMPDMMQRARSFASQSYAYFEAYTVVALVYLIITLLLSKIVSVIEARLNYYDRRK